MSNERSLNCPVIMTILFIGIALFMFCSKIPKSTAFLLSSLLLALLPITQVAAQVESLDKPRFEAGAVGIGVSVAAYPSSAEVSQRALVVPWFIYRSDKVKVEGGGVKMIAYQNDWLTIDLGLGGSLNADTSITPLRDGMPDIDYLFELGPRFDVRLFDRTGATGRDRLNWISAFRFAVSTDFKGIDYRGPVLKTGLKYRKEGLLNDKLSFSAGVGSTWLGDPMMDYFFAVESEFATSDRPQFDANGGFLGVDLSASFGYDPVPALSTFVAIGVNSYSGSKNDASPLFEEDINTRLVIGASWRFYKSARTVSVADE